MNSLAASILPAPAEARPSTEERVSRRRRFLEAALLAQPVRDVPLYRPYSGSGFSRAIEARARVDRDTAA